MEHKNINEMTKSEMATELDDIRTEYDRLALIKDIMTMVDRMATVQDLEKIKNYVEKVYNSTVADKWGFWFGVRDNIVDMANNLAEMQSLEQLQYFNTFMYGMLLTREPQAVEGLHTMTQGMKNVLLEKLQKEKVGVA